MGTAQTTTALPGLRARRSGGLARLRVSDQLGERDPGEFGEAAERSDGRLVGAALGLPVGDRRLGDVEFLGQLRLGEAEGLAPSTDYLVEHPSKSSQLINQVKSYHPHSLAPMRYQYLVDAPELQPVDDLGEPELYTDPRWKEGCTRRLKELGLTQRQLAEHVTGDPGKQSTISNLLSKKAGVQRSGLVLKISKALGVPLPAIAQLELIHLKDQEDSDRFLGALVRVADVSGKTQQ